jgi:single-strand DNA-binding protein
MAGSVNKVILVGNVGKDPEIRTTQDGKEIANLILATSETWKDRATGEKREKTEWHRIVIFSEGLVSIVKNYVKKGAKLFIEGSLQTRKWTDNSGAERFTTEIVLQGYSSSLTMLDSKAGGSENFSFSNDTVKSKEKESADNFLMDDLDDEIPF